MRRGLRTALLGNSIGANIFMVGYAYQLGALPLSAESIERAIELNGEAVPMNLAAFQFGPPRGVRSRLGRGADQARAGAASDARRLSQSFDETVARRVAFLTDYQNADYAARYKALVGKCRRPRPRRRRARAGSPTRSRAICSS
jgi:indolepyruvate ferredoxin oxidoreductase